MHGGNESFAHTCSHNLKWDYQLQTCLFIHSFLSICWTLLRESKSIWDTKAESLFDDAGRRKMSEICVVPKEAKERLKYSPSQCTHHVLSLFNLIPESVLFAGVWGQYKYYAPEDWFPLRSICWPWWPTSWPHVAIRSPNSPNLSLNLTSFSPLFPTQLHSCILLWSRCFSDTVQELLSRVKQPYCSLFSLHWESWFMAAHLTQEPYNTVEVHIFLLWQQELHAINTEFRNNNSTQMFCFWILLTLKNFE